MLELSTDRAKGTSTLVAAMLVLFFLLPSIRAYIPLVPRAMYFVPLLVLVFLSLVSIWDRPQFKLPFVLALYVNLCVTFCIWLMLSSIWTTSTSQYQVDLVLLGTIVVLILSGTVLLDKPTIEIFFRLICVFGAIIGLVVFGEFIVLGNLNAGGTLLYNLYLTIAHLLGLAATGASIRYLVPGARTWLWGVGAVILFMELALSLARGALLSSLLIFLISSICILVFQLGKSKGFGDWVRGVGKFGVTVLLGLGTMVMALQIERTRTRLLRMLTGDELEEGGRGTIWREALLNIQDSPWFGYGLSSNGPLSMGRETDYPHNLFLQVWLDIGILGPFILMVILLIPIFSFLRALVKSHSGYEAILFPLVGMYSFLFLEYSKSENFYAGRDLFLIGLCITILSEKLKMENKGK